MAHLATRDLLGHEDASLQARIATEGIGAALLAARGQEGHWGRGFYQPKWTSSHYTLLQLSQIGLDPGVESTIKAEFSAEGKTIGQLETNAEQLGFFDGLPEADQEAFLEGVLEDPAAMKTQLTQMVDAWSRGDVKAIARTFGEEFQDSPELKKALLLKRNANWARWVKGRLDKPGTVLVAVGAGHLAGDGSVVSLLEKQGLKVTRVQ